MPLLSKGKRGSPVQGILARFPSAVIHGGSYRLPQNGLNTKRQLKMSGRISPLYGASFGLLRPAGLKEPPQTSREIHAGRPKSTPATSLQPAQSKCSPMDRMLEALDLAPPGALLLISTYLSRQCLAVSFVVRDPGRA
ncbi:hypothetical protein RRF57_007615 [Xylaria bambusicola]|uniref:Uncharacterized protein n=1 Tax=Xylaria bambusicola TaxID=326684 RepID=A0AAN7UU02_9PEZI